MEQSNRKVYCVGVGPCGFLNDAMGPNKGGDNANNNCELYFVPDKEWSCTGFPFGMTFTRFITNLHSLV